MNNLSYISILFFFLCFHLTGQTKDSGFSSLSSPEKWWVVWHPFKAKKALTVSVRTLEVTDSIKKTGSIGVDMNGGKLDAFKHAFWMASMSYHIGQKASLKLGKAHEKGNYRSFLQGRPEDGVLPDKVSSDMDLFNNEAGGQLANDHPKASEDELILITIEKLQQGGLKTIKKDQNVFLTCEGVPISEASLIGKWENGKCLIPSNDL